MASKYVALAPLPYNATIAQRATILSRLSAGPATVEQLQSECSVPSPTKRISELREGGHQIDTCEVDRINPDGTVNRVALYFLRQLDARQTELNFETL